MTHPYTLAATTLVLGLSLGYLAGRLLPEPWRQAFVGVILIASIVQLVRSERAWRASRRRLAEINRLLGEHPR